MKRLDGWSGKIFDGVDGDFSTERNGTRYYIV